MQVMAPVGAAALGASMANHRHHHGMSPLGAAAVGATVARHRNHSHSPHRRRW